MEDDAQNGGDHVDAHRSIAYVVGPYVKQGARRLDALHHGEHGAHDRATCSGWAPSACTTAWPRRWPTCSRRHRPRPWTYTAIVPEVLRTTRCRCRPATAANSLPLTESVLAFAKPRGDAGYWAARDGGPEFRPREDALDTDAFNRALWRGLMGERPYPTVRHGRDLSADREVTSPSRGAGSGVSERR